MLLDEPSFGLAPLIVRDLFKILGKINREDKVTILVVEQNAQLALELADLVLDKAKVAFVPGEAFGAPGFARFSFALGDDDLRQGIEQLAAFVGQ